MTVTDAAAEVAPAEEAEDTAGIDPKDGARSCAAMVRVVMPKGRATEAAAGEFPSVVSRAGCLAAPC